MTAPIIYTLRRHRDVSNVSGTGDVATIVEFGSGLTVLHWDSDTPSVQVHTDFRHIEQLHGHKGASSIVELNDTGRLLDAYKLVAGLMTVVSPQWMPLTVRPHPDHADRLRITFAKKDAWDVWIRRLDGSTNAATHEELNGETEHRWVSPDGAIWLAYYTPLASTNPNDGPYDPRD
jgi:hypothetical protein